MDANKQESLLSKLTMGLVLTILILGIVTTVTGCSTTPQVKVVDRVETRLITVPAALTTPVKVTAPPPVKLYVAGTREEKETMLTQYVNSLLKDLGSCNKQLTEIQLLQVKQQSIVDTKGVP